jgi:hypothetical protein
VTTVDCYELSADEKLALASAISDKLEGKALALIKGDDIVIDELSRGGASAELVRGVVNDFISRRKEAEHYSLEIDGDTIIVHSAVPIRAMRYKRQKELPPNLKKCPFCGFLTLYEEEYVVHVRAHGFV